MRVLVRCGADLCCAVMFVVAACKQPLDRSVPGFLSAASAAVGSQSSKGNEMAWGLCLGDSTPHML